MADHAISVEVFYGGAWHDAPAYVRDGIGLSRGAPGEGQEAPPSSASLTLDDRTGDYSPATALVGRNTPVRVTADGSVQSFTELGRLANDRNLKGNDAWAKVAGGGILRRLQQGKTPLRSALERAVLAADPAAFWPLYDGKDATSLLSGVGGNPLALYGARPGEVDGPVALGGAFLDVAGAPVSARGEVPAGLPAAGWGFEFMFYVGAVNSPGEQTEQVLMLITIGADEWDVFVGVTTGGAPYIIVGGFIGANELALGNTTTVTTGWNHARVTLQQVSTNVQGRLYVGGVHLGTLDEDTVAGSLPAPSDVVVGQLVDPNIPDFTFETLGVGMLAFYPLAAAVDHSDAAVGYSGELAGERFLRVGAEFDIPVAVLGDETDTQPMGPQPMDTVVNVLRECVRTDDGMLFEPRDELGLIMRTGRSLRNQDPAATLSFLGGFAPGFVPVTDDANTRNDVTAQRPGGGSFRAQQTTGPLNVNDPIDDPEGVGRYDTTISVNPASDDRLVHHAHWALSKGTVIEPRYPSVTIDLDGSPGLIATLDALEIGDRVDIEDLPAAWSPDPVALLLLGTADSFPSGAGDRRRLVRLNLAPASPYEVLLAGNTSGSVDLRGMRVGTIRSTVDGSHTSGDTTILIDSDGIPWTTSAADFDVTKNGGGMFLTMGRELVRVTSIAGAGSAWTLTVVRSVNGVVGTIADGTPVRFRYPGRIGL